jgi:hypothetical protein
VDTNQFLELEYSIMASSAVEGQTYCFRVTQNGTPLDTYNNYPSVTISADVTVNTFGSQIATVDIPATILMLVVASRLWRIPIVEMLPVLPSMKMEP